MMLFFQVIKALCTNQNPLMAIIDFQNQQIAYLRSQVTGRPRFNDEQRYQLAKKAKAISAYLDDLETIVKPETLMRWYRKLVKNHYTYQRITRLLGRPRLSQDIVDHVIQLARDNPWWGYRKVEGCMRYLGYNIAKGSVANILKVAGIDPAPKRGKHGESWGEFIRRHKEMWATDFFTQEVLTLNGFKVLYVLFFIKCSTREVVLGGITEHPKSGWVTQAVRNQTSLDSPMEHMTHLIHDRDTKYCGEFQRHLRLSGVEPIKLPPLSPNLNAFSERFVRTIKTECLRKSIFTGERSVENAVKEFITHYNFERPHQGIGNQLIRGKIRPQKPPAFIQKQERLGGLLNFYVPG